MRRTLCTTLVALVVAASPRAAHADPLAPDDAPDDADVRRRLAFLEQRLALREPAASRFFHGWYAAFGALTLGQAAIAIAATSRDLGVDRAVGAVASSFGLVGLALGPMPGLGASARLAELPDDTPAARRRKLAVAERALAAAAKDARFGRSWVPHALGLLVSGGSGLVLAFGYGRPASGFLSAAAGLGVAELQIATRPADAAEDARDYGRLCGGADAAPARPPRVAIEPAGLGLIGRF